MGIDTWLILITVFFTFVILIFTIHSYISKKIWTRKYKVFYMTFRLKTSPI